MHLSREDFDKIYEAFGPCTSFYECRSYEEEKELAEDYETLNDYIQGALDCEDVWMDGYLGANDEFSEATVNEIKADEAEYVKRVKSLMCDK